MKGILCYDSRYGSTIKVCQWIISEIKYGEISMQNVNTLKDHHADYYIIGTPIFIGKPMNSVVDFIKNNKNDFTGKPIFLFIMSWAESTVYRDECKKFIEVLKFHLSPCSPVLAESLPGKLVMDKITPRDRKIMGRLLRRVDNMSDEFQSETIIFNDQRSKLLSQEYGRKINEFIKSRDGVL